VGRTSVVLVVEVVDDAGALVAHVTQSQVVLPATGQRA
jgi:acyl-coenzyme A thioesterase PaaI-like protein